MTGPMWDQNPKRRGSWAHVEGYIAHCYLRSADGWLMQWCRPAMQMASDDDLGPHPPETPLCEKCAYLSGVADRLRR